MVLHDFYMTEVVPYFIFLIDCALRWKSNKRKKILTCCKKIFDVTDIYVCCFCGFNAVMTRISQFLCQFFMCALNLNFRCNDIKKIFDAELHVIFVE